MSGKRFLGDLMANRRWVYYLDKSKPSRMIDNKRQYLVCIVVEDEQGYFPSGSDNGGEPYYWTEAMCKAQNKKRGLTPKDENEIVISSMFPKRKKAKA